MRLNKFSVALTLVGVSVTAFALESSRNQFPLTEQSISQYQEEHNEGVPAGATSVNLLNESKAAPVNAAADINAPTEDFTGRVPAVNHEAPLAQKVQAKEAGGFTIQLGSFMSQSEADEKIADLRAQNIEAFVVPVMVGVIQHFRVCTGHFQTAKEAKKGLHEITMKSGVADALVQKLATSSVRTPSSAGKAD